MNWRNAAIGTLFLGGLATGTAAAASRTSIEKLAGVTPVNVIVNDKPRVYFRIQQGTPLVVPIEGPVRVRVVSRVECAASGVSTYALRASEGATTIDEITTESSASTEVRLERGTTPLGKSRRLTFDVPAGRHRIALALSGAAAALVRIQTSSAREKAPMVSLAPADADRSVDVVEGEKLIPYYSVVAGKAIHFRVIGPTTLELSTRLNFDATMRGTQTYRLRVSEATRAPRDLEIKTTKATAASFRNVRDRIPSKLALTRIPVANGSHEITIELLSPARATVQVHARIPEPSVGNEE